MANDLNRCDFIGRLGADPEIRNLPSGDPVANMRLAVGSSWKDKQGEKQERTEWVPVCVFGGLAKVVEQYLRKGSQVYVSGRFQTRQWEKDGEKRYTTEIVVDQKGVLQMLGGKNEAPRAQGQPRNDANEASKTFQKPADDFDDDIPF